MHGSAHIARPFPKLLPPKHALVAVAMDQLVRLGRPSTNTTGEAEQGSTNFGLDRRLDVLSSSPSSEQVNYCYSSSRH